MIATAPALERLAGARVLVTGAFGSIGAAVVEALRAARIVVYPTDLPADYNAPGQALDVRDPAQAALVLEAHSPTHVLHLAGAKHAPEGERDPAETARTNIVGTENVLAHAGAARVVTASTCKACDPETAYGATKLVAERMTLNAGGSVARFYNVPESSGNVFRLWESLPVEEPLPVAPCTRYFIGIADAVALLLWAAVLPPARYTIDPGPAVRMDAVAEDLYPGRPQRPIAPRRGDRVAEPLAARHERVFQADWPILRVESPHDPVQTDRCHVCDDTGTVCESHPTLPWEGLTDAAHACRCGGAGMPCPACCSPIPADGTHSIVEAFIPDHLRP